MTSPFIYDKDIPATILVEIQKSLEPWVWIVPAWCERVFVGWDDDDDDNNTSARTETYYPYRWARITFYPCFLKQNDTGRDALHELIHIPLNMIAGWSRATIETLTKEDDDSTLREVLLAALKERVEAATEDLASRIISHVK